MIIYGAIFRCLDPILTIAAGLSYKDPFVTPLNCRLQADQVPLLQSNLLDRHRAASLFS